MSRVKLHIAPSFNEALCNTIRVAARIIAIVALHRNDDNIPNAIIVARCEPSHDDDEPPMTALSAIHAGRMPLWRASVRWLLDRGKRHLRLEAAMPWRGVSTCFLIHRRSGTASAEDSTYRLVRLTVPGSEFHFSENTELRCEWAASRKEAGKQGLSKPPASACAWQRRSASQFINSPPTSASMEAPAKPRGHCDLTDILDQRDRDYCIGALRSRWRIFGAEVCGAGGQ